MLLWQQILLFHSSRVIWLFYYFLQLQVHILHGLENISIFNIWKLSLVRCYVNFSETSLMFPKISQVRRFPFGDPTLKVNNSRTAGPIPVIYISYVLQHFQPSFIKKSTNLFSCCSSPLTGTKSNTYLTVKS